MLCSALPKGLHSPRRSALLALTMQLPAMAKHQSNGRLMAVFVMLLLWLGLSALDFSPALHCLLHKDAQSPSHNCLVTQLQHHLVLPGTVVVLALAAPAAWGVGAGVGDFHSLRAADYLVSDDRAPPSFHSSKAALIRVGI